jgi:hypothetical protein
MVEENGWFYGVIILELGAHHSRMRGITLKN